MLESGQLEYLYQDRWSRCSKRGCGQRGLQAAANIHTVKAVYHKDIFMELLNNSNARGEYGSVAYPPQATDLANMV